MSFNRRLPRVSRTAFVAAAVAAIWTAGAAAAQPRPGTVLHDSPLFNVPQFVVHAVNFRASNETGLDRLGSDEVRAVFANFDTGRDRATSVYGDVDAGETKIFTTADRCIAPLHDCLRGARSFRFGIALWERDKPGFPFGGSDFCFGSADWLYYLYQHGTCAGDDLIGRIQISLTEAELLAALPTVGASADHTVKPTGGAGSYTVTYRITRLANAEGQVVVDPGRDPPQLPITLTATSLTGPVRGIRLAWAGATGNRVDIYRNGALLADAPNSGSYDDRTGPGAYQYRVCNAGTNVCSADVTGVVS